MTIEELTNRLKLFPKEATVIARYDYFAVKWQTAEGETRVMSVTVEDEKKPMDMVGM